MNHRRDIYENIKDPFEENSIKAKGFEYSYGKDVESRWMMTDCTAYRFIVDNKWRNIDKIHVLQ